MAKMSYSGARYPFGNEQVGMSYAEKDDEYRKSEMDRYCLIANEFFPDYSRMLENYKLKNNQLRKEDYRFLCGTLGSNDKADIFIDSYNFTSNIIESMKGEELGRPFPFTVVANSERINNRTERLKREAIHNITESIFKLEIEKVNRILDLEMSKIPKEEMQAQQEKIEKEFKKRFNNIPEVRDVFMKYESIQSLEEITMNKVMKILYNKHNIKRIKNNCFEDLLLASGEFVEIYNDHENDLPKLKRLNPLKAFYQKSPDVEWIHESDFAGYRERISVDQAIEWYGEYMDEEDYNELITQGANWGVTGMNQKFFSDGKNPDPWRDQRFGDHGHGYGNASSFHDDWLNVGMSDYGGDTFGFIPNPNAGSDYIGLHTTLQRRNMNRYIDKFIVYWKSKRKIGKLTYVNEYGEIDTTIVDEDFVVPRDSKKTITKRDNLTADKIEYSWMDARENKMTIQWIWINEVWRGVRLGRKHIIVEPMVATYRSLLNPFEIKLPIYGIVTNNANAVSMSKMDSMKPWQKLYFAMMAKLLKLVSQDRGIWTYLNTMFMDKEIGIADTMAIAEDQGYIFFNPMLSAKDGGQAWMAQMKIAEKVDMSNFQAIQQYIQMLQFIEENIIKAAGMSAQRVAQTVANSTATDNYRETQSSMNITEPLFYAHDVFWEHVMKGYMEMVLIVLSENSGILREVLNDEEKTIVDLGYVNLIDNYNLRVGNSGKQVRILEKMQELAQALIQNDKVNLGQLITLMKTDNLSEFQVYINEIEEQNRMREEAMQKSQQEHEKEMLAEQTKLQEDIQKNELDKEYLKGYMAYQREQMKAVYDNQSFDAEKDYNRDGIADYMQLEQMQQKIDIDKRKVDLEAIRLDMESKVKERELASKDNDIEVKRQKQYIDAELSEAEMRNKANIERMKSKAKGNKSK